MWSGVGKNIKNFGLETLGFERLGQETIEFEETVTDAMSGLFLGYNTVQTGQSTGNAVNELMAMSPEEMATVKAEVEALTTPTGVLTRNKDTKQLLNEGSWLASSGNVDGGTRNWTGKMKQNYGMIYAGVLGKTGGNAEDIMGLTVLDEIMGNRHDVQIAGGFEALAKDFNIIMGSGKGEITDSEVAKLEQELNAGVGKNLTVLDSVSGAQMYKTILGEAMSVSTGGKIKSFETGSDVEKQKAMALVLESDKFGEIVKNTREEVFGPSKGILLDEFTPTLVLNPDEAAAKLASLNGITRNKDTKQLLNEGSWLASSGNVDGGTRNWTGKMKQNYGMIYAGVLGKTGGNAEDIMGLTVLDEIMGNRHDVQIAGGFEALAKDFNIIMGSGKGEITDSEVAKLEQELNAGVGKNLTVLDSVSGAQMYKTILGEAMSVSTGGKIKSFETGSDVEKQKAMALVLESDKFGEIVKNTREEVFGPSKGILLDEFTPTLVLNPDEAAAKFAETELYKKVQGLDVDFSTDLAKGWDDALDTFESLKTKITNVTGTEYAEHINDNLKDFTTFAAMHGTELKTVVKSELKKDNLSRGKRQNLQKILIGIDAVGQTSDEDGNLIADLDSRNDRHKAYAKAVAAGAINPKTGEILDAKQLFSINEVGFKQIATGGADAATVKLFMDTKEAFQIEAAQGDEQAREQLASMEAISGKMSYGGIKAAIIAGTVSGAHASLEVTEGDLKVADKIVATNRLLQTIVDDGLKTK
ncbi:MAG: hypothetical protein H8E12_14775 [Rhodobacteraceae bacterium]|nr:hypothetical protein [Paracoccaceae bacterium]